MSTCARHYEEAAEGDCRSCGRPFCARCLVYAFGPKKPPFCVNCAIAASGVRSASRVDIPVAPKVDRRAQRLQRRAERAAAKDAARAAKEAARAAKRAGTSSPEAPAIESIPESGHADTLLAGVHHAEATGGLESVGGPSVPAPSHLEPAGHPGEVAHRI